VIVALLKNLRLPRRFAFPEKHMDSSPKISWLHSVISTGVPMESGRSGDTEQSVEPRREIRLRTEKSHNCQPDSSTSLRSARNDKKGIWALPAISTCGVRYGHLFLPDTGREAAAAPRNDKKCILLSLRAIRRIARQSQVLRWDFFNGRTAARRKGFDIDYLVFTILFDSSG
jgi:hypothetical protein